MLFKTITALLLAFSLQTAYAVNAPQFSLKDSAGKTVSLKKYRGKVVYVDFWASWCTPCKQSFPFMNELHERYGKKGLKIIGINLDADKKDADKFLKQVKADFTIAYDPSGKTAEKYDLQVMPSSYLIDRNGRLVYLHRGFKAGDKREMEEKIVQALKRR
ncbi:MAG TPA: TlpA family protein disulfide reductase [Thiotrichales bacterium]|nr:TlpA family protein disulfide reductase [Thiotrichales bacterium]